jgi:hypothetical protein
MSKRITFALGLIAVLAQQTGWTAARVAVMKKPAHRGAVLRIDPGDMRSRNLYYGIGGKEYEPHGVMTFVEEDRSGTSPKFTVRDVDGVKWKVKLGPEVQPEIAATRLIWAVGYFTDEDYFVVSPQIRGLPPHLHRGDNLRSKDGSFRNVRFERRFDGAKKVGAWKWRRNPFTGTPDLNALRVLMALINNWDLKDANNAVYEQLTSPIAREVYLVSDLGASFGTTGLSIPKSRARGDLENYARSKFITKTAPGYVDFSAPSQPNVLLIFTPIQYFNRTRMRWIGDRIPREDARWVGNLLARLSSDQIRDAFRAAGYGPAEVEGFTRIVRQRITALEAL